MEATVRALDLRQGLAFARNAIIFAFGYILLDWASYIYPMGPFNITPWNPSPALVVILVLFGGLQYAPVVFLSILGADVVTRSMPASLLVTVETSLALTVCYCGLGSFIRARLRGKRGIENARQLWLFVFAAAASSVLASLLYVGVIWLNGLLGQTEFSVAAGRFWLGDTVGILVTAPMLLVAADAGGRQYLLSLLKHRQTRVQYFVLICCLALLFGGLFTQPGYLYVLFVPLIWISLTDGLNGAATASAVIQIGVVAASILHTVDPLTVQELQALVVAVTLTGLFLGVTVDERHRASIRLKRSENLAAAAEMAGAIAHEINQPLTALQNYARACQLIANNKRESVAYEDLSETIDKMFGESKRAADVVRRLRNLFQRGATQLEMVSIDRLIESVRTIVKALDRYQSVRFEVRRDPNASAVMADPVQVELVLRNLIANAFDAVSGSEVKDKAITLAVTRAQGGQVSIRMTDSGPGISPKVREHLFEPFNSNKANGMGLGLAIGLTVAEAHGGSLRATATDHGDFELLLPGVTNGK